MNDSRKRVIRTIFQTTVSAAGVLLIAVPAALSATQDKVSPELYGKLAALGALIVGVAGAVTRVMHLPAVIGFLDTYAPWLSASAQPEPHVADEDPADAVTAAIPITEDDALIEG